MPSLQTRTSGVAEATAVGELMRAPFSVKHASGVTKKKTAHNQAAHGERLHCCRIGPKPIPPCSPSRLVALSRSPDAVCILVGLAAQENGTKVLNVINRSSWESAGPSIPLAEQTMGVPPSRPWVSEQAGTIVSESVLARTALSRTEIQTVGKNAQISKQSSSSEILDQNRTHSLISPPLGFRTVLTFRVRW